LHKKEVDEQRAEYERENEERIGVLEKGLRPFL
jgi:hypothetical protein